MWVLGLRRLRSTGLSHHSLPTFLADLAGEHAVAPARPPAHPGLVEDAFLPGFDQLQQVQV